MSAFPDPAPGQRPANPVRGEASLAVAGTAILLRPSFAALVAAEGELGPLFALVERAADGRLGLAETATLFWHCAVPQGAVTREELGEAVLEMGLAAASTPLRQLLGQILQGR
ncbi:gene transfer agent family protein [Alteraurantiacibacter palmitatis]|uniref:Gene transfer agent family protein n=1 Tax=Alteraurantiacibacter palmitatis TaxID=2054628 RepID=A0ABV7E666_9SPHN